MYISYLSSRGVNPLEKARAAEEAGGSTSLAQILKVVQDEYLHGKYLSIYLSIYCSLYILH